MMSSEHYDNTHDPEIAQTTDGSNQQVDWSDSKVSWLSFVEC